MIFGTFVKWWYISRFFFHVSNFRFYGFSDWQKWQKNSPKQQKIMSVMLHISGTIHHMIVIYGTLKYNDNISRRFSIFFTSFFKCNKQLSLEWCCISSNGEIIAESCRWASNIKISILLKKGWLSYVRVSLKQEE